MRAVNVILHIAIVVLLGAGLDLHAQYNGNDPSLVQSYIGRAIGEPDFTIAFPGDVTTGHLEVVCVNAQDNAASTYTISSTRVPSWSHLAPILNGSATTNLIMYYGVATSSGAESILLGLTPATFNEFAAGEYQNISGTTDGTDSQTAGGSPASISNTVTTSKNGSIIVSCGGVTTAQTMLTGSSQFVAGGLEGGRPMIMSTLPTTTAGAYTITSNNQNGTSPPGAPAFSPDISMQSVAFRPSALAVTTTLLPNTDKAQTYSATLKAVGGTGSYSWTVSAGSLPTGCSLSAGGVITCSPATAAGTASFTAQVTESGGGTTATAPLTLLVDNTAYSTPAVVQTASIAINSLVFSGTVAANNTLLVFIHGFDTHGEAGWVPPTTGASNNISDALGSTWRRVCSISGTLNGGVIAYAATAGGSGAETVFFNSTSGGTPLVAVGLEINGSQSIVDCDGLSYTSQQSSTPYNVTVNQTTPIANDLLVYMSVASFVLGQGWSMSPAAGWAAVNSTGTSYDYTMTATKQTTTAGSYSGTTTVSGVRSTLDTFGALMVGVRPGLLNASAALAGEKIRRVSF